MAHGTITEIKTRVNEDVRVDEYKNKADDYRTLSITSHETVEINETNYELSAGRYCKSLEIKLVNRDGVSSFINIDCYAKKNLKIKRTKKIL